MIITNVFLIFFSFHETYVVTTLWWTLPEAVAKKKKKKKMFLSHKQQASSSEIDKETYIDYKGFHSPKKKSGK